MAEMITLREYLDELGRMLEQDAPTEVISHCRYILQHFPQNVDTYRLLGKALLQKGHQENRDEYFSEAAEVFRRVLGAVLLAIDLVVMVVWAWLFLSGRWAS